MLKYEAVIGLEVHAQLKTKSKLFSSDGTNFDALPNQNVSPITLGHPGTLPKMNKEAITLAIKMGLVCASEIATKNYFARKNYFYPDLPKGYQISQHTTPICRGGNIQIHTSNGVRTIKLTRIHLEEDAGKSIHDQDECLTLLDYNRAGMPLIEIVSEPDLHTAEEAAAYLTQIRKLVRWIDICDGNMEEGSLRCDANISVRPLGSQTLGTRVEVKNLNSIKHLKHAIEIEVDRLSHRINEGKTIIQETRGYDADKGITFSIRSKEDAEDYRYFPEPDLAVFKFTPAFINEIKTLLPPLPNECYRKYVEDFGLSHYDAEQLTEDKFLSDLFEKIATTTSHHKIMANTLLGPVRALLNAKGTSWERLEISVEQWGSFLSLIGEGTLSFSTAVQKILPVIMNDASADPMQLVKKLDLMQDADSTQIYNWVQQVIASMPEKVEQYRKGKKGLIGLFVGEVKKISKGKADPKISTQLFESILNEK